MRLVQDLRYAGRTLRKNPVFTTVAVVTLTLGIGANSAIFTLINAALLRPLPFPVPEQLVLVWEDTGMFGLKDSPVAVGNYVEWQTRNHVFQAMGALEQRPFRLTGTGDAKQLAGSIVTASLFPTLGVQPALGRRFREEEDQPGASKTVILSDRLWRREFGGDTGIVGRAVEINDEKYVVAGVMPPDFYFPDQNNEIWAPVGTSFAASEFSNRGRHNAMVVARLRAGTSVSQATAEMSALARGMEREFPRTNSGVGAFVAPLRDHFVANVRTLFLVLGGAVGCVLLIACANTANLLLSRASNQRREVAIRTAVGANRGQIARQLLTENLLLAASGGICGLGVALWGVRFVARLLPKGMAGMSAVTVDTRVLLFTAAISVLTGVTFGLVPVFETLRVDLHQTLKQGGGRQGTTGGSRILRRGLVISEAALAFVLVVGAALFLQSFARLRSMDPGFRPENILTVQAVLSGREYRDPARRAAFYDQVLARVTALPGVISAGFTNGIPLVVKGYVNGFAIEGNPTLPPGTYSNANYRVVTTDYLKTIGIPLREGRYLDRHDTAEAPPVLLINQAMKQKFWPHESALGRRIRIGPTWVTVAGIVGNIRQSGLDRPPSPELYLSSALDPSPLPGLAVRTAGDPRLLAAAVRREIREVDRSVPLVDLQTMEDVLDSEVFQRRVQMLLVLIFAVVAVLLAALGIYGVLAYLVAQRSQEIGVRMALGARPRDILVAVAGQGLALSATGIALGVGGTLSLSRVISTLLFGITARDPATILAAAPTLLAVSAAACYVPARRAMRIDPIAALREE